MKHSFIDRYASLESPLHTLAAMTKLLSFSALIIAVLFIPAKGGVLFFLYFFLTAILMGVSQVPLAYIIGRTLLILPFIMLAGLAAPWDGYAGLTALFIRAVLCLMLLILLTNTTRFSELLRALRRLGLPQVMVMNLNFLYRYFFVLTEEALRMKQARDCRRVGKLGVKDEVKTLSSMLGTLLIRSFERAERMHQAMLSRAYSGEFPVYAPRKFSWPDLAFLSGAALFIAATHVFGPRMIQ